MALPVAGTLRRSVWPPAPADLSDVLNIVDHPSPNFGERRGGVRPDMVVLHYTAMTSADAALERLCCPDHEVSAHYLIDGRGVILRLVDEENRAWHAGAGQWGRVTDVNSHSIGIELANPGTVPFAADQMDALERLLTDIIERWFMAPERVIAHSDMAPSRKIDPGPRFDWRRLALGGLSVWPQVTLDFEAREDEFLQGLAAFGYPDAPIEALLPAFRARFRPNHHGPLDAIDMAMAHDLATRFPVDPDDWLA